MYIEKNITTSIGITAAYHEVQAIHSYFDTSIRHVDVASYVSAEAKTNGAQPIEINQIECPCTSYCTESELYAQLLQQEKFLDGILHE